MAGEVREAEWESDRTARQIGRMALTFLAVAALVVSAFVDWAGALTGDKLTVKALVSTNFHTQGDFVKTAGALAVLIALVALLGLVDRTGWVTRLAGAAFHHSRLGVWLLLGGGVLLLIGGFLGARVVAVPAVVEAEAEREAHAENRARLRN